MDDPLKRYRSYLALFFLFAIVLAGTVFLLRRPEAPPLAIVTSTPRPTPTMALFRVDVRGAVANPGVYALAAGSRVQDALALAGGALAGAETRTLNLARKLTDGEQIYIPTLAEATLTPAAPTRGEGLPSALPTPSGPININTAPLEELDRLPGIGPALAQRIIDYRTQNGPFKKLDDIKQVRGIGDVLFDQIKDLVTLE